MIFYGLEYKVNTVKLVAKKKLIKIMNSEQLALMICKHYNQV